MCSSLVFGGVRVDLVLLPVSLDCSFLIVPSVFSNVYCPKESELFLFINRIKVSKACLQSVELMDVSKGQPSHEGDCIIPRTLINVRFSNFKDKMRKPSGLPKVSDKRNMLLNSVSIP